MTATTTPSPRAWLCRAQGPFVFGHVRSSFPQWAAEEYAARIAAPPHGIPRDHYIVTVCDHDNRDAPPLFYKVDREVHYHAFQVDANGVTL